MSGPAGAALVWAAYVAVILVAAPIYVRILPSSDQSIFDYLAWLTLLLLMGMSSRLVHARPVAPDFGRQEGDRPLKLADTLDFVDTIRSESGPADTVIDWGREYEVAFLAERRSPTKFFNVDAERLIRPGQPIFGDWLAQLERDVSERPRKFILVDASIIPRGTKLPATGPADAPIDQIIKRRVDHGYHIRQQRGDFTLLERVGDGE